MYVAIVGGGPAGLMAAEVLSQAKSVVGPIHVHVFDAMPSVGRKFLLAGRGGLNLTHAEPQSAFLTRFAEREANLAPLLDQFGALQLQHWAHGLGIETFIGTSSRVFPKEMKAAPLLRAWLQRLRQAGVVFHARHRWTGFSREPLAHGSELLGLAFLSQDGPKEIKVDACVLALGGASWSRLGSDGAWVSALRKQGVEVSDLLPANCGFDVRGGWSTHLSSKFAGQPVKPVVLSFAGKQGECFARQGEFVLTETGVEGSLIYAAASLLRKEILSKGQADITLDLLPAKSEREVLLQLQLPRAARSLSEHLRGRLGLHGLKVALLHELVKRELIEKNCLENFAVLAKYLKALPLTLVTARPIDEAISSAGGVRFEGMDSNLMLGKLPGIFCAGEMLDWEAPTGGYLLTACFSTGRRAGLGAAEWLTQKTV